MVTSATNIFSLATTNFGLVTTLVTRFLYDLDLKLKQTFHLILLCFCRKKCTKSHKQSQFRGRLGTAAVLALGLYLNHRGVPIDPSTPRPSNGESICITLTLKSVLLPFK